MLKSAQVPGNMTKTQSQKAKAKSKAECRNEQPVVAPLTKKQKKQERQAKKDQQRGQLIASEVLKVTLRAPRLLCLFEILLLQSPGYTSSTEVGAECCAPARR